MSYTMTIDEPKEAAWFEETSRTMTPSELGALFVVLLRRHMAQPKSFAEKWREAVGRSSGRLAAPYKFNRTDAYPEGKFA